MDLLHSVIPPNYLNPLGFISYHFDGKLPWDSSTSEIIIPDELTRATDLLAMDTEMVVVWKDGQLEHELARVSIVNEYGVCVYDTFVKPTAKIFDTNEKLTGITEEIIDSAPGIKTVLDKVFVLLKQAKVIVGHHIEHDLRVLRLLDNPGVMKKVEDTQRIYRNSFPRDYPQEPGPGLERLAERFFEALKMGRPKSSILDSQVILKLYLKKLGGELNDMPASRPLQLSCGHFLTNPTYSQQKSVAKFKCNKFVEKSCPCGHKHSVPCHMDPILHKCQVPIPSSSSSSSGVKSKPAVPVLKFTNLQLKAKVQGVPSTHEKKNSKKDEDTTSITLNCGHAIVVLTTQLEKVRQAKNPLIACNVMIKCSHGVMYPCDMRKRIELGRHFQCLRPCDLVLPCGHACTLSCHAGAGRDADEIHAGVKCCQK